MATESVSLDTAIAPLDLGDAHRLEARTAIVQRLGEIVGWPSSRIPLYERQLAADILIGLLRTCSAETRARVAAGMAGIDDPPKGLLRYLARDEIKVALPLLENSKGLDDSDLIATIRAGVAPHWLAIARRRGVSEAVIDALVQTNDIGVIEAALRNNSARFSSHAIDLAVARSRGVPALVGPLSVRPELRPTQALVLFWWAPADLRLSILRRFPVDRSVLIAELGEVFSMAAREDWADAEARKTLQLIERRQRNRAAAQRSPHGSLETAVARAEAGLEPELMQEIAHLSGVKPATAQQMFSDPGGEPIAVLCKATGLKRGAVSSLWKGLKRPMGDPDDAMTAYGRTMLVFEILSTAKAQTVLRYWNWSFTADATRILGSDGGDDEGLAPARRNAALLLRRAL
ncbi:MAG: DUF2336 domain-containing protein [Hyphomonadaceae bacterium]|nr:DUF2336 domain-containing protein [Hyphomonadaceae bacterium]